MSAHWKETRPPTRQGKPLLTVDDIKNRLYTLVYTKQTPMAKLCRETGMDKATIAHALAGRLSDQSIARFTMYFMAADKGVFVKQYAENYSKDPEFAGAETRSLVRSVNMLCAELREEYGQSVPRKNEVVILPKRKLLAMWYRLDWRIKRLLLEKHPTHKIWLPDAWDYWRWKEQLLNFEQDQKSAKTPDRP